MSAELTPPAAPALVSQVRTACPTCRRETLVRDEAFIGRLSLANQKMINCPIFRCKPPPAESQKLSCGETLVFGAGEGAVKNWPKNARGNYDHREVVPVAEDA